MPCASISNFARICDPSPAVNDALRVRKATSMGFAAFPGGEQRFARPQSNLDGICGPSRWWTMPCVSAKQLRWDLRPFTAVDDTLRARKATSQGFAPYCTGQIPSCHPAAALDAGTAGPVVSPGGSFGCRHCRPRRVIRRQLRMPALPALVSAWWLGSARCG